MTLNDTIRANIQAQIDSQGVTKAELCRRTGLSPNHLDGILWGVNGVTIRTLERICTALKVAPREMVE